MASIRPLRRFGVVLTLLVALVCLTFVAGSASRRVPIQVPSTLRESASAPRSVLPPPSTAMPLLQVPIAPELRSAGLYKPEDFPDRPRPRPNVNQEPLPLSPPGTYLHSAVLIDGKMYVYGGVASYEEDKYFNDMWLYDFGSAEYVQLQGNYVPPAPNHAGLSTGEAASFAPQDVPAMPGLATAPRHEESTIEALHPGANPVSGFLPKRRAQRPVRITPLEHIYAKDADKPNAAGFSMKQFHQRAPIHKPAFQQDTEAMVQHAAAVDAAAAAAAANQQKGAHRHGGRIESAAARARRRAQESQAKQIFLEAATRVGTDRAKLADLEADIERAEAIDADASVFLETAAESSTHHRQRLSMVHRALRAVHDAKHWKNPSNSLPLSVAGTPYAQPRFHRDGVAADYASERDGRPVQGENIQRHHPNTESPTSAPRDQRERAPHALQDFWQYEFDTHTWKLVGINSSQPLAHSPWLTPQQLNDPVFKDPLPILLPPTRRLHTAVVMKDRMIVFGGVSYNNLILGDLWIFDPSDASWIEASADGPGGSPILPREGHTAVVTKDGLTMLVFGGVSYGFLPFNDLWSYSAVDNAWYRLSKPTDKTAPMQRWLHTAVYHESTDEMIIFGGITAHYVPLNDVHVYDVGTNTWRQQNCLDTPPFPRMMHTAVTIKDIMIISGGAANNLPMDDMFLLDLKTWRWKELIQTSAYPFARTGASAIVLSPRLRSAELLEIDDLSSDSDDPHLQWQVDHAKVARRPVVGSFSSEGLASHEEQYASLEGLDEIAFPTRAIAGENENENGATPRPIYRYRKHMKNNYFFVLFGGAWATSAPQDETHQVPDQNDEPQPMHPLQQQQQQAFGGRPFAFIEMATEVESDADADSDATTSASSSSALMTDAEVESEFDAALASESQGAAQSTNALMTDVEFESEYQQALESEQSSESDAQTESESAADAESEVEAESQSESESASESAVSSGIMSESELDAEFAGALDQAQSADSEAVVDFEREWSAALDSERRDDATEPSSIGTNIFLQLASTFSPDQAARHKTNRIGKMRENRVRTQRIQNKRLQEADNENGRDIDASSYGPYDERTAVEEARELSPELNEALDIERTKRLGAVRGEGMSRAPFCATFPWCQQTPPPPEIAELPPPEDPEVIRQEMARLDPMKFLPVKLAELKKDPHRFGLVFQHIYQRNHHNDQLAEQLAGTTE